MLVSRPTYEEQRWSNMNDMTDNSMDQDDAVYKIGDLAEEFGVTLRT